MPNSPNDRDQELPRREVSLKDGDLASAIDLREFLSGLGTVMQLPQKAVAPGRRKQSEKDLPTAVTGPRRNRRAAVLVILALALGAAMVVPMLLRKPAASPPELQGRWITTDSAFIDRSLEITAHGVAIERGRGDVGSFVLTRVQRIAKTEGARFVLGYRGDDNSDDELALDYSALPHPQLRLTNRPDVVWERTGATQ